MYFVFVTIVKILTKATEAKINANIPTTFVVILLNLRSMAAFAVLAAGFAAFPSSILSATVIVATKETNCHDLEDDDDCY